MLQVTTPTTKENIRAKINYDEENQITNIEIEQNITENEHFIITKNNETIAIEEDVVYALLYAMRTHMRLDEITDELHRSKNNALDDLNKIANMLREYIKVKKANNEDLNRIITQYESTDLT